MIGKITVNKQNFSGQEIAFIIKKIPAPLFGSIWEKIKNAIATEVYFQEKEKPTLKLWGKIFCPEDIPNSEKHIKEFVDTEKTMSSHKNFASYPDKEMFLQVSGGLTVNNIKSFSSQEIESLIRMIISDSQIWVDFLEWMRETKNETLFRVGIKIIQGIGRCNEDTAKNLMKEDFDYWKLKNAPHFIKKMRKALSLNKVLSIKIYEKRFPDMVFREGVTINGINQKDGENDFI